MAIPQLDPVSAAIHRSLDLLLPVASEVVPIEQAVGRILAEPLTADRDSPPNDVSAMDGYALKIQDCQRLAAETRPMKISAVARAGNPPVKLTAGEVVQIFTGASVPEGADCVIRREDTLETPGEMQLRVPVDSLQTGQNIRYRGENICAGGQVLPGGTEIGPATIAAVASFGGRHISVRRKIQVTLLTTGDELVSPGAPVQPWQIRDSNTSTLLCWLERLPWINLVSSSRIGDTFDETKRSVAAAAQSSDAVVLTGGVSAGDTDYVLPAIESLGGKVVFHRLPIRPGKPVLVAMLGKTLIVGLPGNPVSAAVTSRVVAQPLLEKLAGLCPGRRYLQLPLSNPDDKKLDLFWYRLIRLSGGGAELVDSQGSGDLVSLSQSDGFLAMPPGCTGSGPWRTWLW